MAHLLLVLPDCLFALLLLLDPKIPEAPAK
jgi:hypothetical protein